jgi:hypothetical protein
LLERARRAVESRAHILVRQVPGGSGPNGDRPSLTGNPSLESDWGALHYFQWAAGESRFAPFFRPIEGSAENALKAEACLDLPEAEQSSKIPYVETADNRLLAVHPALLEAGRRRRETWRLLRDWATEGRPSEAEIRSKLSAELSEEHRREIERLKQDYEARLASLQAQRDAELARRLEQKLLELVRRYPPSPEAPR